MKNILYTIFFAGLTIFFAYNFISDITISKSGIHVEGKITDIFITSHGRNSSVREGVRVSYALINGDIVHSSTDDPSVTADQSFDLDTYKVGDSIQLNYSPSSQRNFLILPTNSIGWLTNFVPMIFFGTAFFFSLIKKSGKKFFKSKN